MQSWTLTSILSEFRLYSGPKRFFDLEQVIESFDVSKLDCFASFSDPSDSDPATESASDYDLPEYLIIHKNLMLEEKRLFESLLLLEDDEPSNIYNNSNNKNNSNEEKEDTIDSFQITNNLFFSNNQTVLSEGISFDRQLRFVSTLLTTVQLPNISSYNNNCHCITI